MAKEQTRPTAVVGSAANVGGLRAPLDLHAVGVMPARPDELAGAAMARAVQNNPCRITRNDARRL